MQQTAAPALRQGWRILAAVLAALFAYYLLGLDQGHLLSAVQGNLAFDQNYIHELLHDARHAAGFACH